MKKLLVAFVAVIALFSFTVRAESGDKQYIVIKNGENVTIYTITDRGENMYGNKDASIDVHAFVNPAVRDLRSYDVPEEAWKMCSMSENGAYSSRASKLNQALQEGKADYENEVENTRYLEDQMGWNKVYKIFLAIAIIILSIVAIVQRSTLLELKKKEK